MDNGSKVPAFTPIRENYFEQFTRKRKRGLYEIIQKNRCELKLVADYEFFRVIGHSSYAQATRYLVSYMFY